MTDIKLDFEVLKICKEIVDFSQENQQQLVKFGEDIKTAQSAWEAISEKMKAATGELSKLLPSEISRLYSANLAVPGA